MKSSRFQFPILLIDNPGVIAIPRPAVALPISAVSSTVTIEGIAASVLSWDTCNIVNFGDVLQDVIEGMFAIPLPPFSLSGKH